jgi:hypothetical protein
MFFYIVCSETSSRTLRLQNTTVGVGDIHTRKLRAKPFFAYVLWNSQCSDFEGLSHLSILDVNFEHNYVTSFPHSTKYLHSYVYSLLT